MKINRLIEILIKLLNKKTVTANELSEYFGVSVRTIYRDIDVLCTCGIPIYTTQGYQGGISLMEDYTLKRTFFTDEEKNNIIFSLQTLQATKYPHLDCALDKLSSLFKLESMEWINIDFVPWGQEPNNANQLVELKQAILKHYSITFQYINSRNERNNRRVEPFQLQFKGRNWYLRGWDLDKKSLRMYKICRIRELKLTNQQFDKKIDHIQMPELIKDQDDRPFIKLELEFTEDALYRLYDDYLDDMIVKMDNGNYHVQVTFPEDEWLYGYILSFGNYVKVIEPEYIRNKIKERISKMNRIY